MMSEVLVIGWLLLAGFFLATVAATILRYREPSKFTDALPPCTIVLPIKGASNYLESNLLALAQLEPFKGEILLAVAREADPAVQIATSVMAKYPGKMNLMVGEAAECTNPKLRNVAKAYHAAKEDIVLFLDDSVELSPALFAELLLALQPDVVAVTAAPYGDDTENFFGDIEAATCNGYVIRIQFFFEIFGLAAAFGNALIFRKQDLEAAGGFDRLKEGPCDDSAFTNALRGPGARVTLVSYGIRRRIGKRSWRDIYIRHIRWMTCTKVHDPILSILEPLIGGLCFNLLGAYALAILLGVSCWIGIILSMVVWYGAEAILHLVCGWRMTFMTPLAWVARDLLHPLFMIGARIGHRVEWRGEAIDMRR